MDEDDVPLLGGGFGRESLSALYLRAWTACFRAREEIEQLQTEPSAAVKQIARLAGESAMDRVIPRWKRPAPDDPDWQIAGLEAARRLGLPDSRA